MSRNSSTPMHLLAIPRLRSRIAGKLSRIIQVPDSHIIAKTGRAWEHVTVPQSSGLMASRRSGRDIRRLFSIPSKRALATHTPLPEKDCTSLTPPYPLLQKKLEHTQRHYLGGRPLSLAEKILYSHLDDPSKSFEGLGSNGRVRGERYLQLKPARVAMQDASAQCV